jgi:hypothetical protein
MAKQQKSIDSSELLNALTAIMSQNIEGNRKLLGRVTSLVNKVASEVKSGTRDQAVRLDSNVLGKWLQLNVSTVALVGTHGLAFLNDLTTAVEKSLGVVSDTQVQSRGETPISLGKRAELRINARLGETAVAPFLVENNFEKSLDVTFQVNGVASLQGQVIQGNVVTFDPPTMSLEPKAQAVVQASLSLTEEFRVQDTYLFRISLAGYQTNEVWVYCTILPAATKTVTIKLQPQQKPSRPSTKRVPRAQKSPKRAGKAS